MVVFSDTFIQLDILFICLFVFCVCPNSGTTLMVRRDLLKAVLCYSSATTVNYSGNLRGFF